MPDHLPTLIVTPHGRPAQILYTYLHTNLNAENYLLTPSEAGDLCVAKLFPPDRSRSAASSSSHSHGTGTGNHVKCEASRNLRWTIQQTGIQNPIYKLTLPNPESPQEDQPLFQVSKPNPNAPWWSLFYFTYAGHLIPPKRVEFGRIQKNPPESGGGTRVAIVGKSDEEKAVWKTLGDGNEDMVEWIVICAALVVLDDEIVSAAEKAHGTKMMTIPRTASTPGGGQKLSPSPSPAALAMPGSGGGLLPPRSPVRATPSPSHHAGGGGRKVEPPPRLASAATAPIPVPQSGAYYVAPPPHPVLPPSGAYDPRQQQQQQQQPPYPHPPQQHPQYARPPPTQGTRPPQQPYTMPPGPQESLPFPGQPTAAGGGGGGGANRAPSGYRPGPGPPPRPGGGDAPFSPGSATTSDHGNGGGAAARMVQAQVEAKRLQKVRR